MTENNAELQRRFGSRLPSPQAPVSQASPVPPGQQLAVLSASPSAELLPFHARGQRPAVISDANALIEDVVRRSRGRFSLMPFLAERRLIRLVTSEHIDGKVYAHLPRACRKAHVELSAAIEVYEKLYRPWLRLVAVGELMAHDERVGAVALADEEDIPVAQLGVLLAPALVLTRDAHLLGAGIGVSEWADSLLLMKQLAELDQMMWGAAEGAVLSGVLAVHGVAALVRLLQRSEIALGLTLGLSFVLAQRFRHELKSAPAKVKERGGVVLDKAFSQMALTFERREDIESQLRTALVAPHETEALEASIARVLVQRDQPIGAAAIHAALPYTSRQEVEVEQLMSVLREQPEFELVRGRGWMLGHAAG